MRISRRGAQRLLARVRAEQAPTSCAECQAALPELANAVLAGASVYRVNAAVADHLDCCPMCESLFIELLDSLEIMVSGPLPVERPQTGPYLSFLPGRGATASDIWRAVLEPAVVWMRAADGQVQRLRISLRLPGRLALGGASAVREGALRYQASHQAAGILTGGPAGDKVLFVQTLPGPEKLQVDLRARRDPGAETYQVSAEVDSLAVGAPRPKTLLARSGAHSWTAHFDERGQAALVLPIESLADIQFEIDFIV